MERLICLVLGYVFGCFQTAYIMGKIHGIDIRDYGSGNAGTTNTVRVLGTKAGLIVFFVDVIKCVIPVVIARFVFADCDAQYLYMMYAAAGAILGHDFPFYMGFKGGKGIAATAGLIVSFHWAFIPMGIIIFGSVFLLTHYVSLGSLLIYLGFVVEMVVLGQMGIFGMDLSGRIELYVISVLLMALAYYKHRSNIGRLLNGTERKTYLTKKNKQ